MSVWFILLIALLVILLATGLILYFLQDRFIFNAEKLPADHKFFFPGDFEELNLETDDDKLLNGIIFKVKEPQGLLFYLHNHSGNIEHWSRLAFYMNQFQLDVLIVDYRGYGKSTGRFTEKDNYKDVSMWYDLIKNRYAEKSITVFGRGIGATFATYLASVNSPRQLLLESPLYNLQFTSKKYYPYFPFIQYLPKYNFDTASHIDKVSCPVYVFHGKLNQLVHYENSIKLNERNIEKIDLLIIEDGNHYNLINHPLFQEKMSRIFKV